MDEAFMIFFKDVIHLAHFNTTALWVQILVWCGIAFQYKRFRDPDLSEERDCISIQTL